MNVPTSPESVVGEIAAQGDPATHYTRLSEPVAVNFVAAGVVGVAGYEAMLGNEVASLSFPVYLAVAAAGIWRLNIAHRQRELAKVTETEGKQVELRRLLGEPIDLFTTKSGLVLRWYGADMRHVTYHDEVATWPDRLKTVATTAEASGIPAIALSDEILSCVPKEEDHEIGIPSKHTNLTNRKGRRIEHIAASTDLLTLTPTEALELADRLVSPKPEARTVYLSRLEMVVDLAKKYDPQNPLINWYAKWEADGKPQNGTDVIARQLCKNLEDRFAESSTARQKNTDLIGQKAFTTVQIRGSNIILFTEAGARSSEKRGEMRTRALTEMVGYTTFEAMWQEITREPLRCSAEEVQACIDIVGWELFERKLHAQRIARLVSPKEHLKRMSHKQNGTYFQQLAKPDLLEKGRYLLRREKQMHKPVFRLLAALGVAAALSSFGSSVSQEVKEKSPALQAIAKGPEKVDQGISQGVKSLGGGALSGVKAVGEKMSGDKEDDYARPHTESIDQMKSGIGNVEADKPWSTASKVNWQLSASPGVDMSGYWIASVQNMITIEAASDINRGTPPYVRSHVEFSEQEENIVPGEATWIPLKDPATLDRDGKYIKVSGEHTIDSGISYVTWVESAQSGGAGRQVTVVPLPVKEGVLPVAATVEMSDGYEKKMIPVELIRTPQNTYRLLLPAERPDGYSFAKINYWVDAAPTQQVPRASATAPMVLRTTGDAPLREVLTLKHTNQVAKALGLPERQTAYTPEQLAAYIQVHKKYSTTPYLGSYWEPVDSRGDDPATILTNNAAYAAALPAEVCNTATLVAVVGSEGGTPQHPVNVTRGFLNNKDNRLMADELHNNLVDNDGKSIEPTPVSGEGQPASLPIATAAPTPSEKPTTESTQTKKSDEVLPDPGFKASALELGRKLVLPLGAALGVVGMGLGVRKRHKIAKTVKVARQQAAVKSAVEWLDTSERSTEDLAERHMALDLLQHLLYAPAGSPFPAPVPKSGSVEERYAKIGVPSAARIKELIIEWESAGAKLNSHQKRAIKDLAKNLALTREDA